ncbi:hypothetical protein B9Z55_005675 [Caenorhabditis nigoni]|uniref:Domain of unknown function WSN domain-containing protein n=1 Tax=Caenorhabditis nigoni TaxID=1611254 RepID=A0A2G5V1V0_9PELO|nr:hypothetical protein B9Z55_005675 [Caenorhabditis nigoni]
MKFIAYFVFVFLFVLGEDFNYAKLIHGARTGRSLDSEMSIEASMENFILNLTIVTLHVNFVALHTLLNENQIDGSTLAKSVMGMPDEFDLESFVQVNASLLNEQIDKMVEATEDLIIEDSNFFIEIEKLKESQHSDSQKQIGNQLDEWNQTYTELVENQELTSFRFPIGSSQVDKLLKAFKTFIEKLDQSSQLSTVVQDLSSEIAEWQTLQTGNLYNHTSYNFRRLLYSAQKVTGVIEKLGGKDFFYGIVEHLNSNWRTHNNMNLWVSKIGHSELNTAYYEIVRKFFKHLHRSNLTEISLVDGFLNHSDQSIFFETESMENIHMMISNLFQKTEAARNSVNADLPDLVEFFEFCKDTKYQERSGIGSNIYQNIVKNWKAPEAPESLFKAISKLQNTMNNITTLRKNVVFEMDNLQEKLISFHKSLSDLDTTNVDQSQEFKKQLEKLKLLDILQSLSTNLKSLEESSESLKLDDLKAEYENFKIFVQTSIENLNEVNNVDLKPIQKLTEFISKFNGSKIKEIKKIKKIVQNALDHIDEMIKDIHPLREYCLEYQNEHQTWFLETPLKTSWQLNNGLAVIKEISEMESDDLEIEEMIEAVEEAVTLVSLKEQVSQMVHPFIEAARFKKISVDSEWDGDWSMFFANVEGSIEGIRAAGNMYGDENGNNTMAGLPSSSLLSLPFLLPFGFLALAIAFFCFIQLKTFCRSIYHKMVSEKQGGKIQNEKTKTAKNKTPTTKTK